MAETLCDDDIALDRCPGCGREIHWEHPRSRVLGIVWHAECLSTAKTQYRSGQRTTEQERDDRMERVRAQASSNPSETMREFIDKLNRLRKAQENLDKMRRGRR